MSRGGRSREDTGEPFVFVSYSHMDEAFRKRFGTHMAPVRREGVQLWFDGDISPGAELDPEIAWALSRADIFVALASPNYLASSYCFEREYGFALRKAARKRLRVAVVLLRQCQWRHTRMSRYKLLPHDAKPVDQWTRRGDAWEDVVDGIRILVKEVRAEQAVAPVRKRAKAPKATGTLKPGAASKLKAAPAKPRVSVGSKEAGAKAKVAGRGKAKAGTPKASSTAAARPKRPRRS